MYRINLQKLCYETDRVFTFLEEFSFLTRGNNYVYVWTSLVRRNGHPYCNCAVARVFSLLFLVWRDYDSYFYKWSLKCLKIRYIVNNPRVMPGVFFLCSVGVYSLHWRSGKAFGTRYAMSCKHPTPPPPQSSYRNKVTPWNLNNITSVE